MNAYRTAFFLSLAIIAALLGTWYWRLRSMPGDSKPAPPLPSYIVAAGPPAGVHAQPAAGATTTPASESKAQPPGPAPALAPVRLAPQELQDIGVTLGTVREGPVDDEIATVGSVIPDQARVSAVQLRFAGWIEREYADQPYQHVAQGQPMFTIYSPQVVTTEQDFLLALRNRALLQGSPVPGVAQGAASLLAASRARLRQWEVPVSEITRLEHSGKSASALTVYAPVSGTVLERHALPGVYVKPGTTIYTLADLSRIWVNAEVQQNDLGLVRLGQRVTVTVNAYPGATFRGTVDFINPSASPASRTVPVRIALANPRLRLMPGMYVNATIHVALGRRLSIPEDAVLPTGTRNVVFAARGGGVLDPRAVELGPQIGDRYIVLGGLKAGETIVTSANFLVDSESQLQSALGAFQPPPPGVSANAAQPNSTRAANLSLTIVPSPPHEGTNRLRVHVSQTGHDLDGAKVSVTFFQPAMPAMGMASATVHVPLSGRGGGDYSGVIDLPSGGTWRATVTVRNQAGAVLATQQRTFTAGGR